MLTGILHLHRTFAYVVLILVFVVMLKSLFGFLNRKEHTEGDRKLGLIALIATHLQLVFGLLYFFIAEKHTFFGDMANVMGNAQLRFNVIEHPFMMILGVVFITVGYSKSKKTANSIQQHKTKALFFLLGLICIVSRIPWEKLG